MCDATRFDVDCVSVMRVFGESDRLLLNEVTGPHQTSSGRQFRDRTIKNALNPLNEFKQLCNIVNVDVRERKFQFKRQRARKEEKPPFRVRLNVFMNRME